MKRQSGFSLIELMISLVLGLIITGGVIQIMVSSRVTNNLNQAVSQVQESGRFIMTRLSRELYEVGRYDTIASRIDTSVDTLTEAAFIQNRPIALAGDYVASNTLGSVQAAAGGDDQLVVNLLDARDCAGAKHGYANDTEFHVVNQYQVVDNQLRCTGYDGRILRGVKAGAVSASSVTLMDNVISFQVQFGISEAAEVSDGLAVRYVTAGELALARANRQQVVAIRLGILLRSDDSQVSQMAEHALAVLNENPITTDKNHYYQVFNQTLALRNMKNFVRSAK
ncbi:PilW family protein [Salinimonas lutimaris]|uniref:PilW family protein n=1 Tax=Salinimonas lutimaris TaxID=914153 RepID=UPI0010C0BA54|nr:PilW family protein [Salinimonas lutimaris]